MKFTNEMCKMIADLEYLIGSACYNPNSYDGWQDIDGCDFRYPINVPNDEGEYTKVRGNINRSILIDSENINENTVKYMKYRFGSNELYVGKGLIKILEYMEKRYNINFDELERVHKLNNQ